MRTLYYDQELKLHTSNPDGAYTEVETDIFDGKCDAFIEGYRYVPAGESWTRSDGAVFRGEMVSPFVDSRILAAYQEQYEAMLGQLDAAYQEGVNSV